MAAFSNDDPSFLDWVGNGLSAATVCYDFEHYKPSYTIVSPLSPPHIPDDELMGIISEMKGFPGFHSCGEMTAHSTWAATLDAMPTVVRDEEVPSKIYSPSIIVDHTQTPSLAYSESASIVSMEETTDLHLPACIPDSSRRKELKRLMETSHYVHKITRPRDEPSGSSNDLSYPNVDGKVYDDKVNASHAQKRKKKNRPSVHISAQKEPVKEENPKRSRSTRVSKSCPGDSNSKINVTKFAKEEPKGFIHVRARRGEATDSHSLAERARREKIRERMQRLQKLVPGCSKVTSNAHMLDEIIKYIQSLQSQVEFLSAKLSFVTPICKFHLEINDILNEEFHTVWPSEATPDPVAVYEAGINCIQQTESAASAPSFHGRSQQETSSST